MVMISFSNEKDNALKNKKVTDFSYFAMQMDDRKKVYFDIGINHGLFEYGCYTEMDTGETCFNAFSCSEEDTFFDIFGEDYKNIHILDKINVDMDCIINQDYE